MYPLPNSNNYLCVIKCFRSIAHPTPSTLSYSRLQTSYDITHLSIWQELFVSFILKCWLL